MELGVESLKEERKRRDTVATEEGSRGSIRLARGEFSHDLSGKWVISISARNRGITAGPSIRICPSRGTPLAEREEERARNQFVKFSG